MAGKSLLFSPRNDLHNFYSSFNSMINSRTRPSETVLMHLLFSISVPHLTYAADVKEFSASDRMKCSTALNNAIRKIITFHRWESIRSFRSGLGYPDFCTIVATRRSSFYAKLAKSQNVVLNRFGKL